jgi:pimeloyl-ACP methyl ester carboxylesterase
MNTATSKDGTTLAFDTVGEGNSLILVGGALDSGTRSFALFSQLATLLSNHFKVFTYDRRGRGDSENILPYAVEREIEDIAALIKEAGGSAFLFGFSSGAALALRATETLGKARVTKLALFQPPYGSTHEEKQAFDTYVKRTNELLESNKHGEAVHLFLADMLPAEVLETMRQSPEWSKLEALAPTLAYDNAVLGDSLVPIDIAQRITLPTLLLRDATFDFVREAMNVLAKAIPDASRQVLEGQDHGVTAETLAPVLEKFFSQKVK